MVYEFDSRVRYSETDREKNLTLVSLVDYFQDCSTFQSELLGRGLDYMDKLQRAWMILSWQIEILRLPVLCEKIRIQTWAYDFKGFYGMRNFAMLDEHGNYLAKANSVWVFMDTVTGHPDRIPPEVGEIYGSEPRLDMEYFSRKIKAPQNCERKDTFSVCRHHLDTNGHVNNGQYIRMAEEYLPEHFRVSRLRVEYRNQAYLHDVVVPMVSVQEHETVVMLCSEEGKPYAIVAFEEDTTNSENKEE